jgi:hypothetical protein
MDRARYNCGIDTPFGRYRHNPDPNVRQLPSPYLAHSIPGVADKEAKHLGFLN